MQNIANKVVIITGASSGIGEATALKLAKEGAKIVLGARREDKLKAIADQIKAAGGEAVYRVTDVVKPEDNAALVALAKEAFGKVDVIFLNAGLMPSSPLSALETANWNAMIDVNIKGVLNGIAAVLPEFNALGAHHHHFVRGGLEGLPRRGGVLRHQMGGTRHYGSPAHGIGAGGHAYPHRHNLPRRRAVRAGEPHHRRGHVQRLPRAVRQLRNPRRAHRQRGGVCHQPAR